MKMHIECIGLYASHPNLHTLFILNYIPRNPILHHTLLTTARSKAQLVKKLNSNPARFTANVGNNSNKRTAFYIEEQWLRILL